MGQKSHFPLDVPNVIVLGVEVYDFQGDDVAGCDLNAFVYGTIRATADGFQTLVELVDRGTWPRHWSVASQTGDDGQQTGHADQITLIATTTSAIMDRDPDHLQLTADDEYSYTTSESSGMSVDPKYE